EVAVTLILPCRFPPATAFHVEAAKATLSLAPVTVTLVVEVPVPNWSLTVNAKISTADAPGFTIGAVKLGVSVFGVARATPGPPVWVHEIVAPLLFGSSVAWPWSVTFAPAATVISGPADATGAAPLEAQLALAGTGLPGQGSSWPTTGPEPKS